VSARERREQAPALRVQDRHFAVYPPEKRAVGDAGPYGRISNFTDVGADRRVRPRMAGASPRPTGAGRAFCRLSARKTGRRGRRPLRQDIQFTDVGADRRVRPRMAGASPRPTGAGRAFCRLSARKTGRRGRRPLRQDIQFTDVGADRRVCLRMAGASPRPAGAVRTTKPFVGGGSLVFVRKT